MKVNILIAMSGLFTSQLDQIRSILLSIISALVLGIPMALVEKLFKLKNIIFKGLGTLIFLGTSLVALYASLTVAALMGVDESNNWVVNYLFSFVSEFSLVNPLVSLIKIQLF